MPAAFHPCRQLSILAGSFPSLAGSFPSFPAPPSPLKTLIEPVQRPARGRVSPPWQGCPPWQDHQWRQGQRHGTVTSRGKVLIAACSPAVARPSPQHARQPLPDHHRSMLTSRCQIITAACSPAVARSSAQHAPRQPSQDRRPQHDHDQAPRRPWWQRRAPGFTADRPTPPVQPSFPATSHSSGCGMRSGNSLSSNDSPPGRSEASCRAPVMAGQGFCSAGLVSAAPASVADDT